MTVNSDLRKSIDEEYLAARTYRERAESAPADIKTAYLHIAQEEDGHALEFRKLLMKQGEKLRDGFIPRKPVNIKIVPQNIKGVRP
jgi:rubrerythrin